MNGSKNNICLALLAFRDGGKVMLNRRADTDIEAWEFIGGGVEVGETPFDAVRREIFEEVNYTLSPDDDLQFVGDYDFEYDETRAKVYFFTAKSPGIDKFSDSEEVFVCDLKFFDAADALDLTLLPLTRKLLEHEDITV